MSLPAFRFPSLLYVEFLPVDSLKGKGVPFTRGKRIMIHFYELATLADAERTRLLRRSELQIDELTDRVRPILQEVRQRGDEALIEFTERFDRVKLTPDRLR